MSRRTRVCAEPGHPGPGPHPACSGCGCHCHPGKPAPPDFRRIYETSRQRTREANAQEASHDDHDQP